MIWCVGFSHASFGSTVRGISIIIEGDDNAETSKKAVIAARDIAYSLEVGWPEGIVANYAIPVYHDCSESLCDH